MCNSWSCCLTTTNSGRRKPLEKKTDLDNIRSEYFLNFYVQSCHRPPCQQFANSRQLPIKTKGFFCSELQVPECHIQNQVAHTSEVIPFYATFKIRWQYRAVLFTRVELTPPREHYIRQWTLWRTNRIQRVRVVYALMISITLTIYLGGTPSTLQTPAFCCDRRLAFFNQKFHLKYIYNLNKK